MTYRYNFPSEFSPNGATLINIKRGNAPGFEFIFLKIYVQKNHFKKANRE
jgi:hypothetical protein